MSTLKELRGRIKTVRSTQKITAAMKMVAASRLRRLQERLDATRHYDADVTTMTARVLSHANGDVSSPLMNANKAGVHLVIVLTASRGLCGSYNATIIRSARQHCEALAQGGKPFELLCLGRRGRDTLLRQFPRHNATWVDGLDLDGNAQREAAHALAMQLIGRIQAGAYASITTVGGRFRNVLMQSVQRQCVWPLASQGGTAPRGDLITEPKIEKLIPTLCEAYWVNLLYRCMVENNICEQAARMTAMDNATRNAEDMIRKFTLRYNRTRQAKITTELTEIISGTGTLGS
jgi:F-type H+-transporting ATPase subunit gamma